MVAMQVRHPHGMIACTIYSRLLSDNWDPSYSGGHCRALNSPQRMIDPSVEHGFMREHICEAHAILSGANM